MDNFQDKYELRIAAMFLDLDTRKKFAALLDFCNEIELIEQRTSENLTAMMRYKWWQDAIDNNLKDNHQILVNLRPYDDIIPHLQKLIIARQDFVENHIVQGYIENYYLTTLNIIGIDDIQIATTAFWLEHLPKIYKNHSFLGEIKGKYGGDEFLTNSKLKIQDICSQILLKNAQSNKFSRKLAAIARSYCKQIKSNKYDVFTKKIKRISGLKLLPIWWA